MAWRKSPPELIALFEAVFPGPPAERRNMFGYPSAFANGQLFMGLFQERMALRLAERDRELLLKHPGAAPFEPMVGRPMREYVTVPPQMLDDGPELRQWVGKALAYARSLPPKSAPAQKGEAASAKKTTPPAAAQRPGTKTKRTAAAKRPAAKAKRAMAAKAKRKPARGR
jgi:TfoX/Sxy family transcriptional regulator of competence genes